MEDIFVREYKTEEEKEVEKAEKEKKVVEEEERKSEAERLKNEANSLFINEHYEEAVKKYSEAIKLNEKVSTYFSNRAEAYLRLERYGEALEDCRSALELDGSNFKAVYRMAVAQFSLGRKSTAKKTFQRALKFKDVKDGERKRLKEWIEKCPDESALISDEHKLVEGLKKQGKWREVIFLCEKILESNPSDFLTLYQLGSVYMSANRYAKAVSYFERANQVQPCIQGFQQLAEALFSDGQHSNVVAVCQLALKSIDKDEKESLQDFTVLACAALVELGEGEAALPLITSVLAKNDNHFRGCLVYGDALLQLKKPREALRVYLRSLLSHAKENEVRKRVAKILELEDVGGGKSGMEVLKEELGEGKEVSSTILAFFATMVKDFGAIKQSRQLYAEAVEKEPSNISYVLNLVHVIELFAAYDDALDAVLSFSEKNKDLSYQSKLSCANVAQLVRDNLKRKL